jgi:hypothetical protein
MDRRILALFWLLFARNFNTLLASSLCSSSVSRAPIRESCPRGASRRGLGAVEGDGRKPGSFEFRIFGEGVSRDGAGWLMAEPSENHNLLSIKPSVSPYALMASLPALLYRPDLRPDAFRSPGSESRSSRSTLARRFSNSVCSSTRRCRCIRRARPAAIRVCSLPAWTSEISRATASRIAVALSRLGSGLTRELPSHQPALPLSGAVWLGFNFFSHFFRGTCRIPAASGPKGAEGSGLDQSVGTGQAGEKGRAALRLCNLVSQKPVKCRRTTSRRRAN